ncbi:MAG: hypothetical protein KAU90_10175 [Sulfurovaceae bacterium]|nr:hypothetical protein [Sulfurovaceae bacterium]
MQFIKFFFGIVLVQMITVILVLLYDNNLDSIGMLRLTIPILAISMMVSFWFSSLVEHFKKDAIEKLKSNFAKERETLKVNAEKAKTKIIKEAQKDIAHEAKTTHAKANFKVGMSFAGALAVGGLFVFAQMMTVGLLMMTTAGGAIGGYYWRGKRLGHNQQNPKEIDFTDVKVIESKKS